MTIRDDVAWKKRRDANMDGGYGQAVIEYAERWANLVEERTAGDETLLESVVKQASHDADIDGITGFMYGAAVTVLADSWAWGERLRKWHNLDIQIGHEGERANKGKGVLNRALLSLG
jgi:hypothetical protein